MLTRRLVAETERIEKALDKKKKIKTEGRHIVESIARQ